MERRKSETKGIYKRGDVYWIRYAGVDGRIIRESSRSGEIQGCRGFASLREGMDGVKEGKEPEVNPIANHNFKELAVEYEKWAERDRGVSKVRNT